MKSGWKTTEFYGRGIASIVGLMVGMGILQPEVGNKITQTTDTIIPIIQTVIDGVVQIIGIVGAMYLQYQQGKERSALKGIEAKKYALHQITGHGPNIKNPYP